MDTFSFDEAVGQKAQSAQPVQDTSFSFEDAQKPVDQSLLGKAGREVGALGEMVLNIPSSMAQVAATAGGKIGAALAGASREEAIQAGQEAAAKIPTIHLMSPEETGASVINKGMGWVTDQVNKLGNYVEDKTGGVVKSDDITSLVNAAMAGGGADALHGAVNFITKQVKLPKASEAPAGEPAPVEPETIAKAPEATGTLFTPDAIINARTKAYNLANQNMSPQAVDAAIKANPLVGKELDSIMAERQAVRQGPLATTLQGEVLPPEGGFSFADATTKPDASAADIARAYVAANAEAPIQLNNSMQGLLTDKVERTQAKPPASDDPTFSLGQIFPKQGGWVQTGIYGPDQPVITPDKIVREMGEPGGEIPKNISIDPFKFQRGQADPKLLARIAAVGIGAATGAYLNTDSPVGGAIMGALGGLGAAALSRVHPGDVVDAYKGLTKPDQTLRITEQANNLDYHIDKAGLKTWQLQQKLESLVPDVERRNAITHAIEGDTSIKLSPKELEAANLARQFFAQMRDAGFDSGVLKTARENYVTHLWQFGKQTAGTVQEAIDRKIQELMHSAPTGVGMSPRSRFAKERTIDTIAQGKALGLTPLTEDISAITGIYGNAMSRSIANKGFIDSLKADPKGLILPEDKAPYTYQYINHPQLRGFRVHPDIAGSMRFMFDSADQGVALRLMSATNIAAKRTAVSFSLFHAKALIDAGIGGGLNISKIPGIIRGTDYYLQQLKADGLNDMIDTAMKGGLKFSLEKHAIADEDVGNAFYKGMADVQGLLDQTLPGAGLPVKALTALNHAVDNMMWARLHTGMKLNTFASTYEKILQNNAKAHVDNPTVKLLSKEEAAGIAASYTNDIFGGLNWRRMAEEVNNKFLREIALSALKPSSRTLLQLATFAPDWTISTTRAMLKAAGPGSGIKGLLTPKTLADLHRQYILRSAAYYAVIGTALNQFFSGKNLWDNNDPTRIDMGDGRTMQWSKHTMEPIHWLMNPGQQALNKMGILPRQVLEQALNVEYLSAKGKMPPMKEGRIAHMAKGVSPISVQQNFDAGSSAGIAGFLGVPIYGKTEQEKLQASMAARYKGK